MVYEQQLKEDESQDHAEKNEAVEHVEPNQIPEDVSTEENMGNILPGATHILWKCFI